MDLRKTGPPPCYKKISIMGRLYEMIWKVVWRQIVQKVIIHHLQSYLFYRTEADPNDYFENVGFRRLSFPEVN